MAHGPRPRKTLVLKLILVMVSLVFLSAAWLNNDYVIEHSVVIDKPVTIVWDYVSDSSRAREWSIYFHHISPLPSDADDGDIGSMRRCFRRADESGMYWDEVVTALNPGRYRKLKTYNTNGYGMFDLLVNRAEYDVEQFYDPINEHQSSLRFRVVGRNFWGRAVVNLSHRDTLTVFKRNLKNIKAYLERGIVRALPYDPHML